MWDTLLTRVIVKVSSSVSSLSLRMSMTHLRRFLPTNNNHQLLGCIVSTANTTRSGPLLQMQWHSIVCMLLVCIASLRLRHCVMWCFCRRTAQCRGINGERPCRVKIVTTPCRLLCHYLACGAIFLATIWPLIEILRSLVTGQMTQPTLSQHWRTWVLRTRLQSHQVHSTALTIN